MEKLDFMEKYPIFTVRRFSVTRQQSEQREFSQNFNTTTDFIRDDVRIIQAPLNIMKAIEMWELSNGDYINHWIGLMTCELILEKFVNLLKLSPQTALSLTFEDDVNILSKLFGSNQISYFKSLYPTSHDFVGKIIHVLLNKTRGNDSSLPPKYFNRRFKSTDPDSLFFDKKSYCLIYKYIALCLSGQLDLDVDTDIYKCQRKIQQMKVNYNIIKYKSHEDLFNVIIKCIQNIKYGFLPESIEYL